MLESEPTGVEDAGTNTGATPTAENANRPAKTAPRKRTPKKAAPAAAAAPPVDAPAAQTAEPGSTTGTPVRRTRRRPAATAAAPSAVAPPAVAPATEPQQPTQPADSPATAAAAPEQSGGQRVRKAATRRPRRAAEVAAAEPVESNGSIATAEAAPPADTGGQAHAPSIPGVLFQPPVAQPAARAAARAVIAEVEPGAQSASAVAGEVSATGAGEPAEGEREGGRRRRRGGRGRRTGRDVAGDRGDATAGESATDAATEGDTRAAAEGGEATEGLETGGSDAGTEVDADGGTSTSTRRRRRRRRRTTAEIAEGEEAAPDDPPNTVVKVRPPREHDERSEVQGVKGSTRLEAKKQRRREGREMGRRGRRSVVITEAEFLARRESVDRTMVVRQQGDRTQIAVIEDDVLVEHFVSTASTARMAGNVYLGRVQNVLPGMEAAFVDIGKGRNAVLYAGEVNFDTSGLEGQPRRIETALKAGQAVVVQVTKDPIGHKGARLTSQVSLAGRYLVYVPEGSMMGISRKLPDTERARLKAILRQVTPEGAGVIVRTAAEGASEEELAHDVARLSAQWADIKKKSETAIAPALLYGEPDLTIRVIRDVFNEDFGALVVQADSEWDTIEAYVQHVAPDLVPRLSHWTSEQDVFAHYRIDEQLAKALDRKVWLPSGGYLIIDRTEAMVVIDVNTGRFVGKGGNLEETVTKNNLEAAEEIVRQLRLRDIGGIIVIDFIDMVLEANRELVLRRLVECLGRDRTKHQVAEVTSLGLVQMTRKRVGNGLLEAFSEVCETCNGRGVIVHAEPVEARAARSGSRSAKPAASAIPKPAPPPRSAQGEPTGLPDSVDAQAVDASAPESSADGVPPVAPVAASRSRRGGRRRGGKVASQESPAASVEAARSAAAAEPAAASS